MCFKLLRKVKDDATDGLSSSLEISFGRGHWGFADSGYQPIFGAEMRKLNIISADCRYLLHFCRMRKFLQN